MLSIPSLGPVTSVPGIAGEVVSCIEHDADSNAPERTNGQQGRCFVLNSDAPLVATTSDLSCCFTEDGVCSPRLALCVSHAPGIARRVDCFDDSAIYIDLPGRRQVVNEVPSPRTAAVTTTMCPSASSGTSAPAPPQKTMDRQMVAMTRSSTQAASDGP